MSNFSFKPSGYTKNEGGQPKDQGFIRSKQDNQLLKQLQLKGKFFDTVDPDATLWADFDGVPFKCASSVEEDYILVKLVEQEVEVESSLTLTGEKEFKNRTEFKGRTRGDKIGTGSFLSDLNLSREVNGLTPFTMQDFEISDGKRLKFEKGTTIDGKRFENSLDVCKYYIDAWINACLVQTQLKKVKPVMGSGKTHRHDVLVPHQYKSDRSDNRPILLSEARKYLEENYDTFIAPPFMEADEVVDAMAARAYDHAKATNTKVRVVKAANDKDTRSKRGILFDWAKSFHFNNPQCWEIKDFSEDVGALEMKKGEVKGGGAVFFAYQLLMMDSADEYSPRKYLPEDFEHFGKGYGDESFYKDFAPLKTSKEVFQKVVDKYFEWFPYGLQYVAWDGTEVDECTLDYLQKHYQLAYMLEGKEDKSTVVDLLDKFEVDYSALVKNNLHQKPVRTFCGNEAHIAEVEALIKDILNNNVKGLKSKKKADQAPMIDQIKEKLESIDFECHYEMVQKEK
ncbi:putative Phi92_gp085 [Vibrio phage 277E43-1]|nr:putative Phi92_gp085 [Vibrio phage 277E43-1]